VTGFIEACRENHEGALREPGNRRFDVLQDPSDPTRFILYEAYRDEAGESGRNTARATLGPDLAVSAFPLYVPV
jgi:quinol monooxygenase YgiN